MRSRHDYDDKFLYSRRLYFVTGSNYDDEVCEARGVVVICFVSSLLGQLRGSVAGWLVSCLVGWLVDWLVGWLVG